MLSAVPFEKLGLPKPGFNFIANINQFLNCIPVRTAVHHVCLRTQMSLSCYWRRVAVTVIRFFIFQLVLRR